jgi:hypothetical protein
MAIFAVFTFGTRFFQTIACRRFMFPILATIFIAGKIGAMFAIAVATSTGKFIVILAVSAHILHFPTPFRSLK